MCVARQQAWSSLVEGDGRLISARMSQKYGSVQSIFLDISETQKLNMGQYEPSSPPTKVFHASDHS